MARPRARTRAWSRRSVMNGFNRDILLQRRARTAAARGSRLLLLFLLRLFLLRGPLVVVPEVFALVAAALDRVGPEALQVEWFPAGPVRVVEQEVVVGVLGDRLQVAAVGPLLHRDGRPRDEVDQVRGVAVVVRLELVDGLDGFLDRLLGFGLLGLAPLVVAPEVGVVAAAPGPAVGPVAHDVEVRAGAVVAVEEGPAPGVLELALIVAVLGERGRLLGLRLQVLEDLGIAPLLLLERLDGGADLGDADLGLLDVLPRRLSGPPLRPGVERGLDLVRLARQHAGARLVLFALAAELVLENPLERPGGMDPQALARRGIVRHVAELVRQVVYGVEGADQAQRVGRGRGDQGRIVVLARGGRLLVVERLLEDLDGVLRAVDARRADAFVLQDAVRLDRLRLEDVEDRRDRAVVADQGQRPGGRGGDRGAELVGVPQLGRQGRQHVLPRLADRAQDFAEGALDRGGSVLLVQLGDQRRDGPAAEFFELLRRHEAFGEAVRGELLDGVVDVLLQDFVPSLDGLGLLKAGHQREGEEHVHGRKPP